MAAWAPAFAFAPQDGEQERKGMGTLIFKGAWWPCVQRKLGGSSTRQKRRTALGAIHSLCHTCFPPSLTPDLDHSCPLGPPAPEWYRQTPRPSSHWNCTCSHCTGLWPGISGPENWNSDSVSLPALLIHDGAYNSNWIVVTETTWLAKPKVNVSHIWNFKFF